MQPRLHQLLQRALARRSPLADDPATDAYRLVNGAGDALPGVAVDRFGSVLVLHVPHDAPLPTERYVDPLADLADFATAIYVKRHPKEASKLSEPQRAQLAPTTATWGVDTEAVLVRENGVRYEIRPGDGLSVGLFLDMREVRAWLTTQTAGRSVLNLFAYTCSFGVVAALGGASRALNLDVSKPYLDWGQQNYAHNALVADPRDFVYGDSFDWLNRFARRSEQFDVLILDPPSYSKTRQTRFSAERDYPRLAEVAARVVSKRGILVAATNHAGLTAAHFRRMLHVGISAAQRRSRHIADWHEPSIDFPLPGGAEPYLKVQALALDH